VHSVTKLLALIGLALGSFAYASANTIWNVNATFQYNAQANTETGSFTLDPSLNLVTWNITVTGTNALADNTYTPGDSISIFPDLTHLDFYAGGTGQYIDLFFAAPLSNAGGTIGLLYGDGGASSNSTTVCGGCGTLVQGSVGTSSTPEPSSISLVGVAGILGIPLFLRRRKRAQNS